MTYEDFRRDPVMTARARELLEDPVMKQMIVIMKDGFPPIDAPVNAPEIASVRVLSQMAGADAAINRLLSFDEPLPPEIHVPKEDWGVTEEPTTAP